MLLLVRLQDVGGWRARSSEKLAVATECRRNKLEPSKTNHQQFSPTNWNEGPAHKATVVTECVIYTVSGGAAAECEATACVRCALSTAPAACMLTVC